MERRIIRAALLSKVSSTQERQLIDDFEDKI